MSRKGQTPGGSGGKKGQVPGQASLFSFFSKAKSPPPSSTPATDPATAATSTPSSSSSSSVPAATAATSKPVATPDLGPSDPTPTSKENAPPLIAPSSSPATCRDPLLHAETKTEPVFGSNVVGRRIEVFWPDDDEYYGGKVTHFISATGKHRVKYDDGDTEDVLLSQETYRWVDQGVGEEKKEPETSDEVMGSPSGGAAPVAKEAEEDDEDDDDEPVGLRAVGSSKKRRVISHDEEEEDGEEELDLGGGAAASSVLQKRKDLSTPGPLQADGKSGGGSSGKKARFEDTPMSHRSSSSSSSSFPIKTPAATSAGVQRTITPNPAMKLFTPSTASSSHRSVGSNPNDEATPAKETREGVLDFGQHTHCSMPFLKDRKDAKQRRPDDPDFDPRTLYVPQSFLSKETPAMRQWWEFKAKNFDTLLFFKVGKFYEIFHMDADVAVRELELTYMKGEKAHSGFPEIAYAKFASVLVDRGYRVARVEQTETPEMMKERNRNAAKGQKSSVVARELCSVLSKGTRAYCVLDDAAIDEPGESGGPLLLSVKEHVVEPMEVEGDEEEVKVAQVEYGICLVDPTTGLFRMGQFADDPQRSRLRTLLNQFPPAEVLIERGQASPALEQMVRYCCPRALLETLKSGDEFWSGSRTISGLKKGKYFHQASKRKSQDDDTEDDPTKGTSRWPAVLQAVVQGGSDSMLALEALGGAVWQLQRSLIDHDLLSMQNFMAYIPPDMSGADAQPTEVEESAACATEDDRGRMVLDGVTLANLEIFRNSYDRTAKGTLWQLLNRTCSPFGARLLREWVCKPLLSVAQIEARLDAVQELRDELSPQASAVRAVLKKLPDLERLLARIHSMGSIHHSSEHPDSRAIMYEMDKYVGRKIADFIAALDGLKHSMRVRKVLMEEGEGGIKSTVLRRIVSSFPDMEPQIQFFENAFDPVQARKDQVIKPKEGVDEEYDETKRAIKTIVEQLDHYLKEQRKRLGCNEIKYWDGKGKDRYQLEVPEHVVKKNQPAEYESKSQRKGFKRFHTETIVELVEELIDAEEKLEKLQGDEMRKLFEKFDHSRDVWAAAVRCLAMLDALCSLAEVSSGPNYNRPRLSTAVEPFISIKKGRHPCQELLTLGHDFIPNDLTLGQETATFLLLSGPNMGGKSTLLRQTCILAILAQVGCFVPAEECHLTPVDRIFTRVGASDRILQGQSTFFVELSETASILQHATSRSLVILDELGRGTSTFDGTAIAHAVAKYMVESISCRALFATHYHSLIEDWRGDKRVQLGHMACLVEPDGDEQKVTFLYHLTNGPSPKSYGINVARLAQLPKAVIDLAKEKSEKFESFVVEQGAGADAPALDKESFVACELLAIMEAGSVSDTLTSVKELWSKWS